MTSEGQMRAAVTALTKAGLSREHAWLALRILRPDRTAGGLIKRQADLRHRRKKRLESRQRRRDLEALGRCITCEQPWGGDSSRCRVCTEKRRRRNLPT